MAIVSLSEATVCRRIDPEVFASESAVMIASVTLASDPADPGIEEVEMEVPSEKKMTPPEPALIRISPPTVSLEAGLVSLIPTLPEERYRVFATAPDYRETRGVTGFWVSVK